MSNKLVLFFAISTRHRTATNLAQSGLECYGVFCYFNSYLSIQRSEIRILKRKMNSLALCVTLLLISYDGLQSRQNFLPSSSSILNTNEAPIWKKCDRRRSDFNQCLSKTIHKTLRLLDKPLKVYGLPSLYDVTFPPDAVIEFGNTTDGLRQKYHNYRIIGLTKPRSVRARYFS